MKFKPYEIQKEVELKLEVEFEQERDQKKPEEQEKVEEAKSKEELPLCRQLGDEIEGSWVDQWWSPKNCRFKKYSQTEARTCIKGKSIALVGDSTARAIWLVNFLFFSFLSNKKL